MLCPWGWQIEEIREAHAEIVASNNLAILHCVSASAEEKMQTLEPSVYYKMSSVIVLLVSQIILESKSLYAVASGAQIIEKHYSLMINGLR